MNTAPDGADPANTAERDQQNGRRRTPDLSKNSCTRVEWKPERSGSDEIRDVAMRHGCSKQDANEAGTEVKEEKPRFDEMRHSVRGRDSTWTMDPKQPTRAS